LLGGVNVLGLTAGITAYQSGDPWLKELLIVLEQNRDLLVDFIQQKMPEIKVYAQSNLFSLVGLSWVKP
jgi:bifunctional pyridoxal-dependent enzyme with beta-cystathionase and maltose regulon repressor activities